MRLFISVNLNDDTKKAVSDIIANLKRISPYGNYTDLDNLHITLAFIGETKNLSFIKVALDKIRYDKFDVTLENIGCFNDIFWIGISENENLSNLAYDVQNELTKCGCNIEKRKYIPHITIARKLKTEKCIKINIPIVHMTVNKISLMKSERVNGHIVYSEIYEKTSI